MNARQLLHNPEVDCVIKRRAKFALFHWPDLRKLCVPLIKGADAVHDRRCRRGLVAHQPQMISKTDCERLVVRLHHLPQKRLNVLLMLFDKLVLTPAHIDDQPDAQRKLIVMSKEPNLLRHAIFDNCEVVLRQPGNNPPLRIMDTQCSIDQVSLHLNRRNALCRKTDAGSTQKRCKDQP